MSLYVCVINNLQLRKLDALETCVSTESGVSFDLTACVLCEGTEVTYPARLLGCFRPVSVAATRTLSRLPTVRRAAVQGHTHLIISDEHSQVHLSPERDPFTFPPTVYENERPLLLTVGVTDL